MKKQIFITFTVILLLLLGTAGMVLYGMGYRFSFMAGKPELAGTGLLVTTSLPDGASVYINDHLTTATDSTLNLTPGEYDIRIQKEGYFPWKKHVKVQKEVVTKADALLFPTTPRLESITINGALNPVIDPTLSKLAFVVASQSARKNGIYVLDMTDRPILTLQSASTQIADDTQDLFSQSTFSWSPNGKELVATISGELGNTTYLLKTDSLNDNPQDVTATLATVEQTWTREKAAKEKARLASLKKNLRTAIEKHFKNAVWAPDDSKILYEASVSAQLPIIIKPRIIGVDSTPEKRHLEEGEIYIYDLKEDKNYKLPVENPSQGNTKISWMPDSEHLLYVNEEKVDVMEIDGSNQTTLFAGPFLDHYVFPWTNVSKVLVLTNLGNQNITPNLYTIGLK